MHVFSNNSTATILSGITDSDVTVTVQQGEGNLFPAINAPDFAYATLENVSGVWEIVKITTHTAGLDQFVIERAQEDSTAAAFAAGSRFEIRLTAGSIESFIQRNDDTIDGGTY